MADLVFDSSRRLLEWPALGKYWRAVSGPYGLGPLPAGLYKVARQQITEYTSAIAEPFKDRTGYGFFLPITPLFDTDRGKTGGRLGIHPDGNKPGTLGCIGITEPDTSGFYNAIKLTPATAKLILEVR
ncbi:hypothetical protein AAIA72_07110 [Hahella sp. SMD15-11]|uniref:YkuD domain-containing protein n=1 Tax=Thermohahella caldifontis TaxID=3142973 RepID=A0AB39V098_9GAMM